MDENFDTLQIEISVSSSNAAKQIDSLNSALKNLQSTTKKKFHNPLKDMTGSSGNVMRDLNKSVKMKIDASDADKASKKVSGLFNIFSSLKRIAFYRLIRSAIKAVGESFTQGAENAYWYAKTVGDQTRYIADAFDQLSSGSFKMSNQLGASWATLKATITPILIEIINLITRAAQVVTQFFAVLGGKSTYLKAIDYSKDWAEQTGKGAKAAKEWKNQLLGFDEINRLEAPSDTSGGSGSGLPDYENMFEEADVEDWVRKLTEHLEAIKTLAKDIAIAFAGWNLANFISQIPALGPVLKTMIGLGLAAYGTYEYVKALADMFENGISWENLAAAVGGAAIAVTGLGLAFGSVGAAIGLFVFGAGLIIAGLHDLAENGRLTDAAFISLSVGILAVGAAIGILSGSFIAPVIALIGTLAMTIHHFWDEIAEWVTGLADKLESAGFDALAGFLRGFVEWGNKAHAWVDEHIVQPFVNALRSLFDMHSPSKLMEGLGNNVIAGLLNGVKEPWNQIYNFFKTSIEDIKNLFNFEWSFPRPKMPHFNWYWQDVGGLLSIPMFNIDWYAKGGFPEDGLFMANHGELVGQFSNGKTAVANNDQIIEGIREGVYEAVSAAMSENSGRGGGQHTAILQVNGREFARATYYDNQAVAKEHGVSLVNA